jgi:hypothetical protein
MNHYSGLTEERTMKDTTGSVTGKVIESGTHDGYPRYTTTTVVFLGLMTVPFISALVGVSRRVLLWESVPVYLCALVIFVRVGILYRREIKQREVMGFGIDPRVKDHETPWVVTADPDQKDACYLFGFTPLTRVENNEYRNCEFGHRCDVASGGFLLPVFLLFNRRKWRCKYNHAPKEKT